MSAVLSQSASSAAPRAVAASDMLVDSEGLFRRNYNRKTFTFPHGLASSPLFDLDALIELARRMPDHRDTYWSNGKVAVNHGWEKGSDGRYSLADTIANIAANDSIVILKHTEQDPVYAPMLQGFLGRVVELSGEEMRADATIGETLILISSPNRITPYHIDGETNFLVQVRGDKHFYVFDHADRSLISHEERERFFSGEPSSAVYRKERQNEAVAYDLKAGWGVHVPTGSPHWVQNKNNVSVAISVNYELRSVARETRIYRVNRKLRRLGLKPTPPGVSPAGDGMKLAFSAAFNTLRALKDGKPTPRHAVWTPPTV